MGHTDSHGSVLSTTALITTLRAHFQSVTAPEKRVKRAMDPKRNSIGSICYLGCICSGLARADRDPYHSVAGLVFACAGTELSLSLTVIFRSEEVAVARRSDFVLGVSVDGFTAVASVGPQRRGKRQWVELVAVVVERERGREQD